METIRKRFKPLYPREELEERLEKARRRLANARRSSTPELAEFAAEMERFVLSAIDCLSRNLFYLRYEHCERLPNGKFDDEHEALYQLWR